MSNHTSSPRILVGVAGGIAAYKAVTLVRRLRDAGAEVRVVMTESATQFVTPLSFQAVCGHPVRTALFDPDAEAGMDHIALARWADRVVVAPATADLMARMAQGLADDLLTTLLLATTAPVAIAPAMNRQMWAHPATRANLALLRDRGVAVIGPDEGGQACGETGAGRMTEPEVIAVAVMASLHPMSSLDGLLTGRRVVVTAGGTREPIDPVRFIANRSSGRMGFALAEAARQAGADVVLIAGPSTLETPAGVTRIDVETAAQMQAAVESQASLDIYIGAAAVADYRVDEPAAQKRKKDADEITLTLKRNPDIIAAVAQRKPKPFVVGFAAETENLVAYASAKRVAKGMDLICANPVGDDIGFDRPDNAATLIWADGEEVLGQALKTELAAAIIRRIQVLMAAESAT